MKYYGESRLGLLTQNGQIHVLDPTNMRPVLKIQVPLLSQVQNLSTSTKFLSTALLTTISSCLLLTDFKKKIGKPLKTPPPAPSPALPTQISLTTKPIKKSLFTKSHGIASSIQKAEKEISVALQSAKGAGDQGIEEGMKEVRSSFGSVARTQGQGTRSKD